MPVFSVAIPHYKRVRFLEAVIHSIVQQRFRDFEIVIADDASPDDSEERIPRLLRSSGVSFRYVRQPSNVGFGQNLRTALAVSSGEFVVVLGNDDALASRTTLGSLKDDLDALGRPAVSFANSISDSGFRMDTSHPTLYRRALATKVLGSGPAVAVAHLRSTSFVGGLVYRHDALQAAIADVTKANLFFQSSVMANIVARGGALASIDAVAVRQNIRVDGEIAPNHVESVRSGVHRTDPEGTNAALLEGLWLGLTPVLGLSESCRWLRRAYRDVALAGGVPALLFARANFGRQHPHTRRLAAGLRPGWVASQISASLRLRSPSTAFAYGAARLAGASLPTSTMRWQAGLARVVRLTRGAG